MGWVAQHALPTLDLKKKRFYATLATMVLCNARVFVPHADRSEPRGGGHLSGSWQDAPGLVSWGCFVSSRTVYLLMTTPVKSANPFLRMT